MSWLSGVWPRHPKLSAEHRARLEAYRTLPPLDDTIETSVQRCVVVDVETSGLQPYSDQLLAIGAVAVRHALVRFDEVFSTLLRQDRASPHANILVHGIDGTTQTEAADPAEGLISFLEFAGRSPLVAFHADFDRVFVNRATRAVLDTTAVNVWLDLAQLAPCFLPEHAADARTLDDWMHIFGIGNYARHEALADAVATAQLLQIVLARAAQSGVVRWSKLAAHARAQRWLDRQGR